MGGGFFSVFLSPRSPQVIMKVDIVYEKEMLYLYVLSSIAGLLLLLLIFLVLYKVGASGKNGHGSKLEGASAYSFLLQIRLATEPQRANEIFLHHSIRHWEGQDWVPKGRKEKGSPTYRGSGTGIQRRIPQTWPPHLWSSQSNGTDRNTHDEGSTRGACVFWSL